MTLMEKAGQLILHHRDDLGSRDLRVIEEKCYIGGSMHRSRIISEVQNTL